MEKPIVMLRLVMVQRRMRFDRVRYRGIEAAVPNRASARILQRCATLPESAIGGAHEFQNRLVLGPA
jgi:hypothetical protein